MRVIPSLSLLVAGGVATASVALGSPRDRVPDPEAVVVSGAVAVLVAGQSNAVGRGEQRAMDAAPEPDVYVVKKDGHVYRGSEPMSTLVPSGTGFGRTLARRLIASGYAPQVWLVNCAQGATRASAWAGRGPQPKPLHGAVGGWLYMECLLQAQVVRRLGIPVVGIAWHQGEAGCENAVFASEQEGHLRTLRERLRKDFGDVPFVGGELARSNGCAYRGAVNAATEAVSDAFVASDGLTTRDRVHFDRASQRVLGERYADALLALLLARP